MTGAAAGKGRPKRATTPGSKPRPRNEREETWPTKRTGTDVPPPTENGAQGPNGLKLSDGPWRRKGWKNRKDVPPWPVRWSAWLGGWVRTWPERTLCGVEGTLCRAHKTLSGADKTLSEADKTLSGAEITLSGTEKALSKADKTLSEGKSGVRAP